MKNYKRYLITSALPYANGPVHIGHLAGVYIPSDIYIRYLRMKGVDVISVCGSDEHGVPITIKARKEGVTPQEIVDRYHSLNKKAFEDFGISFDIYSRTSNKIHYETASEFFKTLYDKGEFIEKTSEQYYDEEADSFLPTDILPEPALIAAMKMPMVTSAKNAELHLVQRSDQSKINSKRQ